MWADDTDSDIKFIVRTKSRRELWELRMVFNCKKSMQSKAFWNTEVWSREKNGVAKIIFIVWPENIRKVIVTTEYEYTTRISEDKVVNRREVSRIHVNIGLHGRR